MVWLADRDEPCLVSGELFSRLMEFLAGQGPAPEPLRDNTHVRAVQPLEHVGLAVLLIDHGRVVLADHLVLVQLLDSVQVRQRGFHSLVRCGVDEQLFVLSHGISPAGFTR